MDITIYHNPNCGTSRTTLAAIRAAGHEPQVVEYLNNPLGREQLQQTASFEVNTSTGACAFRQMEVQAGPSLDESAATLRDRIRGRRGAVRTSDACRAGRGAGPRADWAGR